MYTSGKTQPLDVDEFEKFDLWHMIHRAYESSFTDSNIIRAFQKAGIYHFDSSFLLGTARPKSEEIVSTVMSPVELEKLLEDKSEPIRAGDCLQPVVLRGGYVDAMRGQVLTSDDEMKMVRETEELYRRKWEKGKAEEERKAREYG